MWLTVLALAITGIPITAASPDACTMISTFHDYIPRVDDTRVIARVLDITIRVHGADPPLYRGDALGRLIRIQSGEGAAFDGPASPGSEVVVFAWTYGLDCKRVSADFVIAPDSVHHFTMRLRPDTAWVDGKPTFDLNMRGWTVYPAGRSAEAAGNAPLPLPIEEYAEMISLLPTDQEWSEDCRPGMNEFIDWYNDRGQPFKDVVPRILGLCEDAVAAKARSLLRNGVETIPEELERWAETNGCRVGKEWWEPYYKAVQGRFLPGQATQWAVLCESDAEWRLVILDAEAGERLMELARMIGSSSEMWSVAVAPPEYFDWSPIDWAPEPDASLRIPRYDSVMLGEHHAFYFDSQSWVGSRVDCCYFRASDGR